jgi:hypothetical protein
MANLCSIATGNWTTAGTWSLVDTTSYLNSESTSTTVTTTASANRSSAFTPGAITITGIAVKLSNRTGTTGTFTVELWNNTGSAIVAGTTVTINMSDLGAAVAANLDGGWIVFDFANVALSAATDYMVQVSTSNATQIQLFSSATTNWSRMLLTSTTQAPVAGDDVVVAGNYTGAGTGNDITVTMNETATTDYGSAPTAANSLILPGVAVAARGTLQYGTTAATNYYLKVSNSVVIYRNGTFNIGTTGTPIPRDGTAVLEFDPAADGDYGLIARNGSTLNIQGLSRTSGKNIVSCKLNTDEAVNSTSLGVDTDTGWLDNDIIAVASTTRTASQCEAGTLNGNAGASSLTVDGFAGAGGGLAFAHDGTSPVQADVILLTRNVKIRSATSTLMAYVNLREESTVDIDWAEFRYLGEAVTNKRGVELNTTTGSFNMQFSSIYDVEDNGFLIAGTSSNNITFSNNTMWNLATVAGPACQNTATSGTNITIDSNILIRSGNVQGWLLSDVGGTFTNNTVVGATTIGISLSEASAEIGTFSGNISHSNTTDGITFSVSGMTGIISNVVAWRNTGQGLEIVNAARTNSVIVDGATVFGNTTTNLQFSESGSLWLKNVVSNGDTTFSTTNGITVSNDGATCNLILDNCEFSTVSGIKTAHSNDINVNLPNHLEVICRNCKFGAATEVASQTNIAALGYIASQKHDQTAGNHKTWMMYGTLQTDSTIFNTVTPSMRMTPNNASGKLESAYQFNGIQVAVANGATVTVNVYTRRSSSGDGAAYTGNQPRLIVKANPAIGITSDTVLDTHTAADGTWEQLSGVTAAATDDGVMEFVVDCDGTAGWVNVDDWSAS